MSSPAIEALERALSWAPSAANPDLKVALIRLRSEIEDRKATPPGQAYDFFLSAARSLRRIKGSAHSSARLDCLESCCHYFYVTGFPVEGCHAAEEMRLLAHSIENPGYLRKALNYLGVMRADAGDVSGALESYAASIELAQRTLDVDGECGVWSNLGVALMYGGMHGDAIKCFRHTLELGKGRDNLRDLFARACTNLASTFLHSGELKSALAAVGSADSFDPGKTGPNDLLSRVIREYTRCQILIDLDRLDDAQRSAALARETATKSGSPRALLMAQIASGLCDVFRGDVASGIADLEEALEKSKTVYSMVPDCLVPLARAHEELGNTRLALKYLDQLFAHVASVRQESVEKLMAFFTMRDEWSNLHEEQIRPFERKQLALQNKLARSELVDSQIEMLERLAVTADLREEASGEHGYRVGKLASLLAGEIGLDREICATIDIAARLHDIGKIGIPDRILLNSQELKDAERHFMSAHTLIGSEMLGKSNIPQLRMAEEIARCHHEWWNGTGYPAKKSGKRIPISARIVALADVFDALTHGRPYEQPWPVERAIEQIRSLRGEQFDPELTDVFLELVERLRKEHADLDGFLGKAGRNSPFLQARNKIRDMLTKERDQEREAAVKGNETRH
jgi:putative two-component system response regulator